MGRPVYEGLKVLDVTNNYAGPMAGSMLADYGAEVWHIEKPVLGDDNRFFPPMIDGISINYCTANRGKKSVVLAPFLLMARQGLMPAGRDMMSSLRRFPASWR